MGNVSAAEGPTSPPSPPIPGMPTPPPTGTPFGQMPKPPTPAAEEKEQGLPNPGNFEDLFKKVKGETVLPIMLILFCLCVVTF